MTKKKKKTNKSENEVKSVENYLKKFGKVMAGDFAKGVNKGLNME